MPASYAHYSFGKAVLPALPADVRQCIQRFRRMYDMGLQGPDFLFFPCIQKSNRRLARGFHQQTGGEFFTHACRAADSEAAKAYLYGVLAHYCLDSACHPFVCKVHENGEANHAALEAEFDRFLLARDGKPTPHTYSITAHIKVTRGECMTIAAFYPPVTGGKVHWAISAMRFDLQFLSGGNREKREKLLRRLHPHGADFLIPLEPVEQYTRMVSELLARYNRCVKLYPVMLEELRRFMELDAPLGEHFEGKFG